MLSSSILSELLNLKFLDLGLFWKKFANSWNMHVIFLRQTSLHKKMKYSLSRVTKFNQIKDPYSHTTNSHNLSRIQTFFPTIDDQKSWPISFSFSRKSIQTLKTLWFKIPNTTNPPSKNRHRNTKTPPPRNRNPKILEMSSSVGAGGCVLSQAHRRGKEDIPHQSPALLPRQDIMDNNMRGSASPTSILIRRSWYGNLCVFRKRHRVRWGEGRVMCKQQRSINFCSRVTFLCLLCVLCNRVFSEWVEANVGVVCMRVWTLVKPI